ncbi:hypothetical protein F383_36752 [Gossypium arboreum]|uniref:Uncharacterized protein n=1 Tax=Gossypium arboreum TaxID=29729 RepID=A0A0B0M5X5_GOSAR|nr:hypothetical protein F383_36752 [Gossypium arboreum]
MSEVRGSTYLI